MRTGGHAVVGAEDDIHVPAEGQEVFWGVELGVVIGRRARNATARAALAHVAGYTVVNDIAVRDGSQDIPSAA